MRGLTTIGLAATLALVLAGCGSDRGTEQTNVPSRTPDAATRGVGGPASTLPEAAPPRTPPSPPPAPQAAPPAGQR
jgi:hypothetical protein